MFLWLYPHQHRQLHSGAVDVLAGFPMILASSQCKGIFCNCSSSSPLPLGNLLQGLSPSTSPHDAFNPKVTSPKTKGELLAMAFQILS